MNNLLVLPMVIPILAGILLVFLRPFIRLQRWISFSVMIANFGVSIYILNQIQADGVLRLDFGDWAPPYGILFVADSFSMLLVLTTSFVTAICLLYAFSSVGKISERMYFYPFVNFMVAGDRKSVV